MPQRPLAGITVIELGQVIAGTYGGTILADLGAEVIKVEPLRGDAARNPAIAPINGESAIHLTMNRGKKSVAIDLKKPEGLEVFERLVRSSHAVVDNFRPGVMERLNIHHERLQQIRPGLVTCSVTGFGQTGPAKDRPAFDLVVQAISGHLHITGEPDGPPSRVGIPLADMAGSLFACISLLAGLLGQQLHGSGQNVDVGMLDSLVSMLGYDALHHLNTGKPVERQGTAHAHMVPWQAYAVQDGYVVIAAREEKFWARLCDAIERPDLIEDPRTRDNHSRVANRSFVTDVLESAFSEKTRAEWVAILDAHDIPAAAVHDLPEVFADPQVTSREMVRSYEHPKLGTIRYVPSPMQFAGWEYPQEHAPLLGEHTVEILTERLGYDASEIDALLEDRVVTAAEGASLPS